MGISESRLRMKPHTVIVAMHAGESSDLSPSPRVRSEPRHRKYDHNVRFGRIAVERPRCGEVSDATERPPTYSLKSPKHGVTISHKGLEGRCQDGGIRHLDTNPLPYPHGEQVRVKTSRPTVVGANPRTNAQHRIVTVGRAQVDHRVQDQGHLVSLHLPRESSQLVDHIEEREPPGCRVRITPAGQSKEDLDDSRWTRDRRPRSNRMARAAEAGGCGERESAAEGRC